MADPLLEFDPVSEDATNSPLSVWNTASYIVTAFNPDAANQTVQWASSVDTEGALPASVKDENRSISMTIECLSAAALRTLQAKVTKISRERGTLKYTLPNSEVIVFDLLARESFKPEFDFKYFVNGGVYCTVSLGFSAAPAGRGPEITALATNTATSGLPLVFTHTGIKGDMSALGKLRITNTAANLKSRGIWGIQSRYYSSAADAALVFEAEDGLASGAALNAGPAGASGGGANKVMRHATVGTTGSRSFYVGTAGSAVLTHVGDFVVYARVWADSANTGTVSTRLVYTPQGGSGAEYAQDWVPVADDAGTPVEGAWVLVRLGMVSLSRIPVGTHQWFAAIESRSTVAADIVNFDWVVFVPATEGTGVVDASLFASTNAKIEASDRYVMVTNSGSVWFGPTKFEGDYVRIPPAGAEGRSVRIVAMLLGTTVQTDTVVSAGNMDAITAHLNYTPRYLVVPEP